mgnify:CR=1 FL=1
MKATAIALLMALSPMMASAENDTARARLVEFKELTTKIEELEKALRLQTLTTQAVRQDNYDLACKSQKEATLATHEANVRDVNRQSDQQYAEICTFSRATAVDTPSWLTPLAKESN